MNRNCSEYGVVTWCSGVVGGVVVWYSGVVQWYSGVVGGAVGYIYIYMYLF